MQKGGVASKMDKNELTPESKFQAAKQILKIHIPPRQIHLHMHLVGIDIGMHTTKLALLKVCLHMYQTPLLSARQPQVSKALGQQSQLTTQSDAQPLTERLIVGGMLLNFLICMLETGEVKTPEVRVPYAGGGGVQNSRLWEHFFDVEKRRCALVWPESQPARSSIGQPAAGNSQKTFLKEFSTGSTVIIQGPFGGCAVKCTVFGADFPPFCRSAATASA